MRLTVYTDFSLRVLMFLALKGDGLATIAEVAKAYGISKNHLMKVAHQLGVAGYVETVRGKGGGLRLARRPQDIVIGEVVRRTEPDMALVPCFDPDRASCAIFQSCALRGALSQRARRVPFGAGRMHVGGPYPSARAAPEIAVSPSTRDVSDTNLATRPAGIAMWRMLARILEGQTRNSTMIGSEPPAVMWHGQTGESKVAKFAADFFAAEIRAWRGEEPLWKVFWVYGVATSVMIVALYAVTFYDGRIALRQVLLLCLAAYTAWVLVSVWRCARNTKNIFWSTLACFLTVAWAGNTILVSDLPPTRSRD